MSLMPSKKCLSESFRNIAIKYGADKRVVLESMSQLVLEDDDYSEHMITKIASRTNLPKKIIGKIFREMREDEELIQKIQIDGFADCI